MDILFCIWLIYKRVQVKADLKSSAYCKIHIQIHLILKIRLTSANNFTDNNAYKRIWIRTRFGFCRISIYTLGETHSCVYPIHTQTDFSKIFASKRECLVGLSHMHCKSYHTSSVISLMFSFRKEPDCSS